MLWKHLLTFGIGISFAHSAFRWSNEGKGVAAVHCVIIGFGLDKPKKRVIFDYPDINGDPHTIKAKNINPYLVDAPTVLIDKCRTPICGNAPEMAFGSMPNDVGKLLLSQEDADTIRKTDQIAAKYIHRFLGADEFINGLQRYCLWLVDSTEAERKSSSELNERIKKIIISWQESPRASTQKLAVTPHLFGERCQPETNYLAIPEVSSERRLYIPIGFLSKDTIASNKLYTVPNATHFHFGVLTSTMHNAWMKTTCGRMKSDYQYSAGIVYNNFPWPEKLTEEQEQTVTDKA